jgi:hypothetical protein
MTLPAVRVSPRSRRVFQCSGMPTGGSNICGLRTVGL